MTGLPSQMVFAEDRSLGHLLYGLMCAFPLFFLPVLLSLLINCSQRQIPVSSLMGSHLRWQRHSIFGLLVLMALGYVSTATWLSLSLLAFAVLWFSYRIFKGWLNLTDGVTM